MSQDPGISTDGHPDVLFDLIHGYRTNPPVAILEYCNTTNFPGSVTLDVAGKVHIWQTGLCRLLQEELIVVI
jgi:hypothetical protein